MQFLHNPETGALAVIKSIDVRKTRVTRRMVPFLKQWSRIDRPQVVESNQRILDVKVPEESGAVPDFDEDARDLRRLAALSGITLKIEEF